MRTSSGARTGRAARIADRTLIRNLAILAAGPLLVAGCSHGDGNRARTAGGHATPGERASQSAAPRTVPPPPRNIDCDTARCVALTFDDGPGPHTARLLDILKQNDACATFFILGGSVGGHEAIVRRMVLEGQEAANHTWSHPYLTRVSSAEVRSQVQRTQKVIKDASGVEPRLLRPPYGETTEAIGRAAGMPQIMWSIDTLDWRSRDDIDRSVRTWIAEPQSGGILLFHDVHKTSVDAMPKVIEGLKKRGFTLVTVSELFRGRPLEPGGIYRERQRPPSQVTTSPTADPSGGATPRPNPS